MQSRDIVVIGTSVGGIEALKVPAGDLPRDLRASVLITLHVAPYSLRILPEILERAGPPPASNAIKHVEVDHILFIDEKGFYVGRHSEKE